MLLITLGCEAEQAPLASAPNAEPGSSASETAPVMPSAVNYQAGVHYELLPQPVATADKTKIEVTEVFWYGCSHCFAFEPNLESWAHGLADDVVFTRSPAMWDQQGIMERHARIYYTAKALGNLDTLHAATFEVMNIDKNPLNSDQQIAAFFEQQGISREKFDKVFNSFGITSAVRQAEARQRSYRIQGTPELIINGKYRIAARMAGSQTAMLQVADYLINQERATAKQ
jgi:thiol:disulfide interchange protein DsbA